MDAVERLLVFITYAFTYWVQAEIGSLLAYHLSERGKDEH